MIDIHVVARCLRTKVLLSSLPVASTLWTALRRAFPSAMACTIMPDHVHLIAVERSAEEGQRKMRCVLSGVRRSRGGEALLWEPVPLPVVIPDRAHLMRQIRYVSLNPARARFVSDPLQWLWSTHRDVVGAVVDPWVTADDLARALRAHPEGFAARHHAYVSADPSVRVLGTPFPVAAGPSSFASIPLERIAIAARVAMRASPEEVQRRSPARSLFIDLARASGWKDPAAITAACGAAPRTIRTRVRARQPIPSAAWLCLGDARLWGARAGAAPTTPSASSGPEAVVHGR